MRKTCVRRTKSVRVMLIAAAAIASAMMARPTAQSSGPETQPRLTPEHLVYIGGFRLPSHASNGQTFEFGGRQIAFNPANNSLFVGTRTGHVAEVSIPGAVNSSNPAAMPSASYLQPFADPTEGRLGQVGRDGVALDGLLVYDNKLYGTASVYYDALNQQRISHYSRSLQLNQPSFSGWSSVWDPAKTGFVSGAMAAIPSEWQTRLGGPAATGQCCIPIVTRTSWGPSAFAFDPARISPAAPAPALPLLYYTGENPTLGDWLGANATYGSTTTMGGMAMIAGTRTALFIGRNGIGEFCYGNGTANPSLHGRASEDGSRYCYDPTSTDKGQHAYPYRYQIWAYDLNDLAAVKAGAKKPWEVKPYGVWPLDLPTPELTMRIGGVSYDATNQLLYVSQMYADQDGYAFRPVIHVLRIDAAPGSANASTTPAPVTTSPLPAPQDTAAAPTARAESVSVVTALSLAASRNSPQAAGTPVVFSAGVVGGAHALEYQWSIFDGAGWTTARNWSASDTFTWTPATPNDQYRVSVRVRRSGSAKEDPEALISTPFVVVAPPELRSVTFTASKPAPQTVGTAVTFAAAVEGGAAAEYRWLLHDGLSWTIATGWSSQSTFTWTPARANAGARVGVWARRSGSTQEEPAVTWSADFPITEPARVALQSVTFAPNKPAPQGAGRPITFTANTGGAAAEYRWLIHDGLSWSVVTNWSAQNTFTWTPAAANASARVGVWARALGSKRDEADVTFSIDYPVTAFVAAPALPIHEVQLATDRTAPQAPGTTIIARATTIGGSETLQYRWLIHDGLNWRTVTDWTSSSTYAWTPTAANAGHFIGVWVRNAINASGEAEATRSLPFPIR
jgi:hypothetical protein